MIHHLSVGTNDLSRARRFYDAVFAVLGLRALKQDGGAVHYGVSQLLFSVQQPIENGPASPGNGAHVAFAAEDRSMVDGFHRAALANGGSDAGAPGIRAEYDPHYYGEFVRDPDGNKLEAVTFMSS